MADQCPHGRDYHRFPSGVSSSLTPGCSGRRCSLQWTHDRRNPEGERPSLRLPPLVGVVRPVAGRLKGDVTLKTGDSFYHVLHAEPQKDEVLAFIAAWMDKRVA
jgi:hypothetical protein